MAELLLAEVEKISRHLPTHQAVLMHKYPDTVYLAACSQTMEVFTTADIRPDTWFEVCYGDGSNQAALRVVNHQIELIDLDAIDPSSPVTVLYIDNHPAYIKVEKEILLNKLGDIELPSVLLRPDILVDRMLRFSQNGSS